MSLSLLTGTLPPVAFAMPIYPPKYDDCAPAELTDPAPRIKPWGKTALQNEVTGGRHIRARSHPLARCLDELLRCPAQGGHGHHRRYVRRSGHAAGTG